MQITLSHVTWYLYMHAVWSFYNCKLFGLYQSLYVLHIIDMEPIYMYVLCIDQNRTTLKRLSIIYSV
jgi:hypothetical protein